MYILLYGSNKSPYKMDSFGYKDLSVIYIPNRKNVVNQIIIFLLENYELPTEIIKETVDQMIG